jgi:hypothetical protein
LRQRFDLFPEVPSSWQSHFVHWQLLQVTKDTKQLHSGMKHKSTLLQWYTGIEEQVLLGALPRNLNVRVLTVHRWDVYPVPTCPEKHRWLVWMWWLQ